MEKLKACDCGKSNLEIVYLEWEGRHYVICHGCGKMGYESQDINVAVDNWNKGVII